VQVFTTALLGLGLVAAALAIDGVPTSGHTRIFAIPQALHESTPLPQRVASKRSMADGGQRNHFGGNADFLPLRTASAHTLSILALLAARLPRQSTAAFQWAGLSTPDRAPPRSA